VGRELKQLDLNRGSENIKIGILLFIIVALIFSVTIVKLKQGALMQGYDHIIRQNMLEKNDE
jgi:high-affinity Fe2+/Pb2+ permease